MADEEDKEGGGIRRILVKGYLIEGVFFWFASVRGGKGGVSRILRIVYYLNGLTWKRKGFFCFEGWVCIVLFEHGT